MMPMNEVSKVDLHEFVNEYPAPLVRSVHQSFDPPLVCYNDFSKGLNWPESVVALFHAGRGDGSPEGGWRVLVAESKEP